MKTQLIGRSAEDQALEYLKDKGLKLIFRNFSCRLGEIDLIMRDGSHLVFVEVRMRTNKNFGDGAQSVTYSKRQKIIKTTAYYIIKNKLQDKHPLRFDIISLDGKAASISWLRDAFGTDY